MNHSSASRPVAGRRPAWLLAAVAGWLAACCLAAPAQTPLDPIIGRWVSVAGAEQIEIKANGFVRTCFAGNKPGSASMGAWTRKPQGGYQVEFTHAITRNCADDPHLLRRYELSIVGNATASRNELALYVSGEFPPDRFVRAPAPAKAAGMPSPIRRAHE